MRKFIKSFINIQLLIAALLIAIHAECYAAETESESSTATVAEAVVEKPAVNRVLLRQQKIASQLIHQDAVWLKTSNGDWLALYRQDETGKKLGTLLLIPDQGVDSAQPGIISFLAKSLTSKGWSTLTVSLPAEDESSKAIVNASLEYLQKLQNGHIYLMLQGQHQVVYKNIPASTKGVVLLNLPAVEKSDFPEGLIASPIPMLDIIATRDHRMHEFAWQRRKNLALSNKLPYRQLVFPGINRNYRGMEDNISRIVSAWLDNIQQETKNSNGN